MSTPTYLLANALVSPLPFGVAIAVGLLLARRGRATGWLLAAAGVGLLMILSTGAVGNALLRTLEPPPLADPRAAQAQAVVILSAGRNLAAPNWGGETLDWVSLERVRYGARLARQTGLPVLVSGGRPGGGRRSLGELMRSALQDEFGVPVRWTESQSLTTAENARFGAARLHPEAIRRVLLVTSASHMRRALATFRAAGFDPVAAPTDYMGQRRFVIHDLVPTQDGLRKSLHAIREWLGNLLYLLRGETG